MKSKNRRVSRQPDNSDVQGVDATVGHSARRAQRADGSHDAAASDAPPSNTASDNCDPEYFKPLRWGVDSLYLSYPGELRSEVHRQLKELKGLAQDAEADKQSQAQYSVAGHLFEVRDKGLPRFPFVLADGCFRIQFANPSKPLPMAYAQVSSTYLAHVGPIEAEEALYGVMLEMGTLRETANVSRIDLFVDFVTGEAMDDWPKEAWVTRASNVHAHWVGEAFTGWSIGLGGILSARLYNKTLEIQKSGKDYLWELWSKGGLKPDETVWRLEFQFERETLIARDLAKLPKVMDHLNGLWSYACTEWLRLTLPNLDDQTRARWPIHPLWGYLSSIDWDCPGGPLSTRFTPTRAPGDDKLFTMGLGPLVSFMAREGITDLYQGQEAFITALYNYHASKAAYLGLPLERYVEEKVALKARQFNTIVNNPAFAQELEAAHTQAAADAYRKQADGE